MKKSLLTLGAIALATVSLNACSIGELKPEPIALATTDTAHFKIDNSAISNEGAICGEKYKAFQNTLRNGFNAAANAGENSAVVNADLSEAKLTIRSIDMSCIGKDRLNGFIINAKVSYSWKIDNGPETIYETNVIGAGSSAEKALGNMTTDMYNFIFSQYLTTNAK